MINKKAVISRLGNLRGTSIADLGVGTGDWSLLAAESVGNSGIVFAIDVDKTILDRLSHEANEKKIENIQILRANYALVGGTKLRDESVDMVFLFNTIFQNEESEYADIFTEATRITKKSGQVIVIDWSDSFSSIGPASNDVFKRDMAIKYAEEAGLRTSRDLDVGERHYGIVFEK